MKNNDLQKLNIFLNKYLSEQEIKTYINKPQAQYFNLSIKNFINLNKKEHIKIVMRNLKEALSGEAMGA